MRVAVELEHVSINVCLLSLSVVTGLDVFRIDAHELHRLPLELSLHLAVDSLLLTPDFIVVYDSKRVLKYVKLALEMEQLESDSLDGDQLIGVYVNLLLVDLLVNEYAIDIEGRHLSPV